MVKSIAKTGVDELRDVIGVSAATELFGVARASYYYQGVPYDQQKQRTGGTQPNALSDAERQVILDLMHSPKYIDATPYDVYASLIDEGKYLGSIRTFYRILKDNNETTPRVNQRLDSAPRPAPRLCATKPNQIWSWDISPIATTMKRRFFYLYVIIDIYSRFVPGWCVEEIEDKDLAKELFDKACKQQAIKPGTLTSHADNGPQMRSDVMNDFYAIAGITRSHSRPRVSNDNPYSESFFRTAKYFKTYPGRFETIEETRIWFNLLFATYNYEHYHSGIGLLTPISVHNGTFHEIVKERQGVLDEAYAQHPERFRAGRPLAKSPEPAWINKPKETTKTKTTEEVTR